MMVDLAIRSELPEKMDEPGVAVHETRQALRELEAVNKYLGGYSVVLNALGKIYLPQKEITIMDFGCGGGDMLRAISGWAGKHSKDVALIGIDRNPVMTEYAREQSQGFDNIQFVTMDVFDDRLMDMHADITTCSLFCHHFEQDALVQLLKRMYRIAKHAVIINDLHRHWFAYHSIKWITTALSKTYLVKYDAPLSVARAFTRQEWERILDDAGIANYSLHWKWAWRWELIIEK